MNNPKILSVGTAVPKDYYTQKDLATLFSTNNPKIVKLFANSHIKKRHLNLPKPGPDGLLEDESCEQLLEKHRQGILNIGGKAVEEALSLAGLEPKDLKYLVCVTSTGYLCPGATAYLIRQHGFNSNIHRVDVVGMGCNAALNAMQPLVQYLRINPKSVGMLVCIENCSAAYCNNDTIGTAVVNSLFGDASAAVVIAGEEFEGKTSLNYPEILDFESLIVTDAMHTMRFELEKGKLSFFLDREIPYFLGNNAHKPVLALLEKNSLKKRDISWWVVHSGGKKVIDSIKMNLDLSDYDLRHTINILENYGNISSCSIMFALRALQEEGVCKPKDRGVMMAMGPGASIETALLRWPE